MLLMGEKKELMGMGIAKEVSHIGNAFTILKHRLDRYVCVFVSSLSYYSTRFKKFVRNVVK